MTDTTGPDELGGRMTRAANLPDLLDAALDAFGVMLTVIRRHDHPGSELFLPMVMAGASAATGRDSLLAAPSLSSRRTASAPAREQNTSLGRDSRDAARCLAGLSTVLSERLDAAAGRAADPGDRDACRTAARHARQIAALMNGALP